MEWILIPFLFVAVMLITAILFGGWLILTVDRLLARGLGVLFAPEPSFTGPRPIPPPQLQQPPPRMGMKCPNERCKQVNPTVAQFCRRCGGALPAVQRVPIRRAAMW